MKCLRSWALTYIYVFQESSQKPLDEEEAKAWVNPFQQFEGYDSFKHLRTYIADVTIPPDDVQKRRVAWFYFMDLLMPHVAGES